MPTYLKILLALACVIVVVGAAYGVHLQSVNDALVAPAAPLPAQASVLQTVYPLYSTGITWSAEESVSLPPRSDYNPATVAINGYEVYSQPTAVTNDIAGITEPFRNQYDRLLLKDGWHINPQFEADGAGGSVWGYTKGNDVLIFSYTTDFLNQQSNTPEQCPCTITFTIIGGTLQ